MAQPATEAQNDLPQTDTLAETSAQTNPAATSVPQPTAAAPAVTSPRKELQASKRTGGASGACSNGLKAWDSSNLVNLPKLLPEPGSAKKIADNTVPSPPAAGASGGKQQQQQLPSAASNGKSPLGGAAAARQISEQLLEAKVLARRWMQQRDAIDSGKAKALVFAPRPSIEFVLPSCHGAMFEGPDGYPVPDRHLQLMRVSSLSPRLNSLKDSRCGTRESGRGVNASALGKKLGGGTAPQVNVPISTSAKEESGDAPN